MSAEDELLTPESRLFPGVPCAAIFVDFWDDAESDQRNIEAIGWWLSLPGEGPGDKYR